MIRRPPRSTPLYSSAASDVYKRQVHELSPPHYIHADARIAISCVRPERHEVQVQSFFEAGVGTTYLPQVYAGLSYFFRLLISLLSRKSPHEILSTGNRIFWEITVLPPALLFSFIPAGQPSEKCLDLSLIHISEPTRLRRNSYAVFCLKKKTIQSDPPVGSAHANDASRSLPTPHLPV